MTLLEWVKLILVTVLVFFILEFTFYTASVLSNINLIFYIGSGVSVAFSSLVFYGIYSLINYKK